MVRKALAIFAIIFGLTLMLTPASAQYGGGVATGGTMALRQGVPHAQTVYEDQCRRIGAHNNPMCMTGRHRHGGHGHHHGYHGRRMMPVYATGAHFNYRVARGYYGRPAAQVAPPPPSPQQIANMVPHKTTSVCVPCDQTRGFTYIQNPETCQCDGVRWRPGPPPQ